MLEEQKAVRGDAECCMVVKSEPTSSFIVPETQFTFEFLIVSLDSPASHDGRDEFLERRIRGKSGKPEFNWVFLIAGPFDHEPFFRRHR